MSCSVERDGQLWDLSSLSSKTDYTIKTDSGLEFGLNICKGVVSELLNNDDAEHVGAFLRAPKGDISIGGIDYNISLSSSTPPSPLLVYPPGAPCPSSTSTALSTLITFTCASADSGPQLLATLPSTDVSKSCAYIFEWRTPAACPRPGGKHTVLGDGGAVGVFFGLLLTVLLAWVLGTVLYNRFILKLRGSAQLPSVPLSSLSWPSLPSFRNPCAPRQQSTRSSASSWFGRGRSAPAGYGRVSDREDGGGAGGGGSDEEEGLVGRFGLDSDSDGDDEDAQAISGDARVWRTQGALGTTGGGSEPPKPSNGGGLISL